MGYIDDMKLQSSMTLFALASEGSSIFHQVIDCFFDGETDTNTINKIISENKGQTD